VSLFQERGPRSLVSRRAVLRGGSVALALPWLESLVRPARAQVVSATPKRFVAIFLPNGAPDLWQPPAVGVGSAWQLSSVLEPLAALKPKLTVISGLENGSAFNRDGSPSVEPSDSRLSGGWLTCVDGGAIKKKLNLDPMADYNAVSLDQFMAAHVAFSGKTALPSLQVGLSSVQSNCDNGPCSLMRSVSWQNATTPLYKTVDPTLLFNQLAGVAALPGSAAPATRLDERQSVLDAVQETAVVARARLSASDKLRLDEFLSSVRSVEKRVLDLGISSCATPPTKPTFPTVDGISFPRNIDGYDKSVHFDLMNELLALALQCDRTRIASYMLEDDKSQFVYDFVPRRTFTALTSAPATGFCPEWYTGGLNGDPNDYASIVNWHVGKVAAFCQRLDGMLEENGLSVLDNSVVFMGGAMHGSSHAADRLPAFLVGGGSGSLKTDQHRDLGKRPLRDMYFTLMNGVYDMGVENFGQNLTGAPISLINELLSG
jgi:Protein of unknown function (DUF1552)